MPPHFSVPGLTCHTELPLRGSAGPVSHARFVLGDYQRQHCAFTPEELCFCSSSRALGAEGQAVLSLKPILSRFVERLCADLCLWCLAAVLIPVPGTFVFPRFAEIFRVYAASTDRESHASGTSQPWVGLHRCHPLLSAQLATEHNALHSATAPEHPAESSPSCSCTAHTECGQLGRALQGRGRELQ